ncbi:MAG: hypothetical protein JNM18_06295, partial [Planctomycetaceae bacterium]|nr:hypothetical protein [Planctomycetaceae bacterium]
MAPSIIEVIFDIEAEHRRFMRFMEPHLLQTMVQGYDLERRVIAIAEEDQRKSIAGLLGQLPPANASGMVSQL